MYIKWWYHQWYWCVLWMYSLCCPALWHLWNGYRTQVFGWIPNWFWYDLPPRTRTNIPCWFGHIEGSYSRPLLCIPHFQDATPWRIDDEIECHPWSILSMSVAGFTLAHFPMEIFWNLDPTALGITISCKSIFSPKYLKKKKLKTRAPMRTVALRFVG